MTATNLPQTESFDKLVEFIKSRLDQNCKNQTDAKAGVYTEKLPDSFYVLNLSVQEQRGFNVLFRNLASRKDIDQRTARTILSGVRSQGQLPMPK